MHLEVDEDFCTACGLCRERAPDNLEIDEEEGIAEVIKQPTGGVENENCTEAVDYCPTGGLTADPAELAENAA